MKVIMKFDVRMRKLDTYRRDEGLAAFTVFKAVWHRVFGEPHGEAGHKHPQNGDLVQHLPEQGQGGVEVGRAGADDDQEDPEKREKTHLVKSEGPTTSKC